MMIRTAAVEPTKHCSHILNVELAVLHSIMRAFIVFFALCCFVAYARNITLTNDELDENIKTCLAKTRLSQAFFKSGDETLKYLTEEQKSCFLACMFKKAGIITHDGSVRSVTDEMDVATANAIDRCQSLAEGNICKLAWCLHKTEKFGIPIISD